MELVPSKNKLWLLDLSAKQTRAPIVIEQISSLGSWNDIWSDAGVLFWARQSKTLVFVDKNLMHWFFDVSQICPPELAYWVPEEEACLLIEDSSMHDDSLVAFLEGEGDHMPGSGNPWELLKSFPELFGFLLNCRTSFATEGGDLVAYGKSSGSVSLTNNDRDVPIHLRQILSQWHTRGAVSVERILSKDEIIVKCDDGLKLLHLK